MVSEQELDRFDVHWNAFCDADHSDYPPDFIENAEALGLAKLVPVTRGAADEAFAYERGIALGGWMWCLTRAGHDAFEQARAIKDTTSGGE